MRPAAGLGQPLQGDPRAPRVGVADREAQLLARHRVLEDPALRPRVEEEAAEPRVLRGTPLGCTPRQTLSTARSTNDAPMSAGTAHRTRLRAGTVDGLMTETTLGGGGAARRGR